MVFLAFIALVTLLTLLLPVLAPKVLRHYEVPVHTAPVWIPIVAALLYANAPFWPDIHISSETQTFQEHFIGGGLYTTMLFVYFSRLLGWRPRWIVRFWALFAWAAALGLINELFEFTLVKLDITHINISDTSWDLVANTTGMLCAFTVWRILALLIRENNQ